MEIVKVVKQRMGDDLSIIYKIILAAVWILDIEEQE